MGIGGQLMWTVLAQEWYEKHNKKVAFTYSNKVIKDNIWINNPHISFTKEDAILIAFDKYIKHLKNEMRGGKHAVITRCNFYGVEPKNLYPILKYTDNEDTKINELLKLLPEKFVCIEPHAKTAWTQNKTFPFHKWQNIVDELIKQGLFRDFRWGAYFFPRHPVYGNKNWVEQI